MKEIDPVGGVHVLVAPLPWICQCNIRKDQTNQMPPLSVADPGFPIWGALTHCGAPTSSAYTFQQKSMRKQKKLNLLGDPPMIVMPTTKGPLVMVRSNFQSHFPNVMCLLNDTAVKADKEMAVVKTP